MDGYDYSSSDTHARLFRFNAFVDARRITEWSGRGYPSDDDVFYAVKYSILKNLFTYVLC